MAEKDTNISVSIKCELTATARQQPVAEPSRNSEIETCSWALSWMVDGGWGAGASSGSQLYTAIRKNVRDILVAEDAVVNVDSWYLPSISVSACCQLVIRPPPHHVKPTPAPNVLYKRRGVARIEMSNLLGGCPYCPCSSENTAVVKHMYTKYCKEILLV